MRGGAQERTVAQRVAQLNAAALAEAAESAGKPVEEMGSKIVVLMDDTGESEELCREALIESRGNKQWAEQIIHVLSSAAAAAGKPVEEMRRKIVAMMKSTNADEKSCREALIESRGNRRWAEQIIHAAASAEQEPELDEAALARAAAAAGKSVEEMRTKLVSMMKSTGVDEKSCREALIESRGNKLWAEQIIRAERERAAAAAAASAAAASAAAASAAAAAAEPELDEEALARAAAAAGKSVEEMRSKIVALMKNTGADEELCREALIESGNKQWAKKILKKKKKRADK